MKIKLILISSQLKFAHGLRVVAVKQQSSYHRPVYLSSGFALAVGDVILTQSKVYEHLRISKLPQLRVQFSQLLPLQIDTGTCPKNLETLVLC